MHRHMAVKLGVGLALWLVGGAVRAENTPLNAKLLDDGITLIECSVRDPRENRGVFSKLDGGSSNPTKSTKTDGYHYNLYLPKGYSANTNQYYPCLFISSPGGKAGLGAAASRLKRDEWIVVMLQESRNGSPDWLRNFLAAHDDAVERVRIARGAKFATGMSGGARCTSINATMRPGFAGILCQAAGFAYELVPDIDIYQRFPRHILVAATFGDSDMNLYESQEFLRDLKQCRVHVDFFKGGHGWCPAEHFETALDWLEEALFVDAARPRKGGSAASAPTKTAMPKGAGRLGKPDVLDEEAYGWYYRKCKRQLAEATGKLARVLELERLLAAINRGALGKDKTIAGEAKAWQTELNTLYASSEYKEFDTTARKAFLEAQKAEKVFLDAMRQGKAEFKKMKFSSAERAALQRTIKAYGVVAEKYPDSPLAAEAKHIVAALELEAAK